MPARRSSPILIALMLLATACSATAAEFVADGPRARLDLNGAWQTVGIQGLQFHYPPAAESWLPYTVPSYDSPTIENNCGPYCGNLVDYLKKDQKALRRKNRIAAWFKREFTLPRAVPPGYRAVLHFHGMAFRSETWFNDQKLGTWLFGQVPVEYDVTKLIHSAGNNVLVVGLTEREGLLDVAHKTFIAPTGGASPGIWAFVELRLIPDVSLDDVFIKTSVKKKRIELETTIVNRSSEHRTVTPRAVILDKVATPQLTLVGEEVSLAPGESRVVVLSKEWLTPHLWSPATPNLYFAKTSLREGDGLRDQRTDRFGFREFEIRGRDFFLNGQRTVLLRNSMLAGIGVDPPIWLYSEMRQSNQAYNCLRLHIGHTSEALLNLADELGYMTIPESGWMDIDGKYSLENRKVWLENVAAYTAALIRQHRNRPSVVMWSLTNETMWSRTTPEGMEVAQRLVKAAKVADPTRYVQGDAEATWGGRLPVINIHYPEGELGNVVSSKYPDSGLVFPNDFSWLAQDPKVESITWRATFKWDRPLMLGEYWCPAGDADSQTSFMGDSVYDWEKWRMQEFAGRDGEPDNEYTLALKRMTDFYRLSGVAALNPWSGKRSEIMPNIAARPLTFNTSFYGGTTGVRKVVVYNNGNFGEQFYDMRLNCRLSVDGETVWQKIIPAQADCGEAKVVDIPIEFPTVSRPVRAVLTVRYERFQGIQWQLSRFDEPVFIMPKEDLGDIDISRIALLDDTGQTAKTLAAMGLQLSPLTSLMGSKLANLTKENLNGVKLLLVGDDTDAMPYRNAIAAFVRGGGSAVILRQPRSTPIVLELPDVDEKHASSRSWKRVSNHPIIAGLDESQLSYWAPDNLVSIKTFRKSTFGGVRHILDCGGRFGMRWSPLVEVPCGAGTFVMSQLSLVQNAAVEPAAARLLAQCIRYALDYRAQSKPQPLRLLAGDNKAIRLALQAGGVVSSEGLSGSGPILLDASCQLSGGQTAQIAAELANGGKLWLHGFSSKNIRKVADLFPFKPQLAKYDPSVRGAIRRSNDPLIDNLSSFDFSWVHFEVGDSNSWSQWTKCEPTAQLGGEVLLPPVLQPGNKLVEPALLVKVPVGKGMILFDNVFWEGALGAEADKVARIVGSLAANLGGQIRIAEDSRDGGFSASDISNFANLGRKMNRIAQWNMGDLEANIVKNRVAGAGALTFVPGHEPMRLSGGKALHIHKGQCLAGDTKQTPGLGDGGPFTLEIVMAAEDKPTGYSGGIFQCPEYGSKGFRLVVDQDMHITVVIFLGDKPSDRRFLTSRTPLDIGRTYNIAMTFDGKYASFRLNGKLDAMIECPPPKAFEGGFSIGISSGEGNLNGRIEKLSVYAPEQ